MRNYGQRPDGTLGEFTLHVATCMTGNPTYTLPPVTPDILRTKATEFETAVGACEDGTKQDTEHKNVLRADLISTLDILADYVELTAQGDREKLLSSGFEVATKASNTPAPVGTTAILGVTNVASTKLGLDLQVADNAWGYETEVSSVPGVWVRKDTFTDPHNVVLTDLVPGTVYAIRARALGSKNQRSEWCAPVSQMAT